MRGGEVRAICFMTGETLIVACRCRERPGKKTYKTDKEKPIYQIKKNLLTRYNFLYVFVPLRGGHGLESLGLRGGDD